MNTNSHDEDRDEPAVFINPEDIDKCPICGENMQKIDTDTYGCAKCKAGRTVWHFDIDRFSSKL